MKHFFLLISISLFIFGWASHANSLSFPAWLTGVFSDIDQQYSTINFNVHNAFNGIFLWRNNKTLTTPVSVTIWSDTINGCSEQLQGLYYNNQRWFRLWPLDTNTLTGLQSIDSSYNALTLTGGLFTNCNGVDSNNVYGALGHIRWGHTYRVLGWIDFDFTNKTWISQASGSFIKNGPQVTGWIFDSQWSIGEFAGWNGTLPSSICENGTTNYPDCNQCPDGFVLRNGECRRRTTGWGWWGGWSSTDYCPDGDFSGSYYDGQCGTPPRTHGSAPIGKACIYDDELYLANGSFDDTIGHRWFPYIEIMRISCLHRWRGTNQWLWIYAPNDHITRAEVLKTVVKILGIEFNNFSITSEDLLYTGNIPFADVSYDNRFAHYADYAFKQGITEGLYTTDDDGNRYIDADKLITRYEAIKIMMLTYKQLYLHRIDTDGPSVMGDVINTDDPYYSYIREAEELGFISGVPQADGSYNFEGQREILRSEFAKIISVPFTQQLFDVKDIVINSDLYRMIVQSLAQTDSSKIVFINTLFNQLNNVSDADFMANFTLDKDIFLDVLKETIMIPILEEYNIQ